MSTREEGRWYYIIWNQGDVDGRYDLWCGVNSHCGTNEINSQSNNDTWLLPVPVVQLNLNHGLVYICIRMRGKTRSLTIPRKYLPLVYWLNSHFSAESQPWCGRIRQWHPGSGDPTWCILWGQICVYKLYLEWVFILEVHVHKNSLLFHEYGISVVGSNIQNVRVQVRVCKDPACSSQESSFPSLLTRFTDFTISLIY